MSTLCAPCITLYETRLKSCVRAVVDDSVLCPFFYYYAHNWNGPSYTVPTAIIHLYVESEISSLKLNWVRNWIHYDLIRRVKKCRQKSLYECTYLYNRQMKGYMDAHTHKNTCHAIIENRLLLLWLGLKKYCMLCALRILWSFLLYIIHHQCYSSTRRRLSQVFQVSVFHGLLPFITFFCFFPPHTVPNKTSMLYYTNKTGWSCSKQISEKEQNRILHLCVLTQNNLNKLSSRNRVECFYSFPFFHLNGFIRMGFYIKDEDCIKPFLHLENGSHMTASSLMY